MSIITVTVDWSLGIFHAHTSLVVLIGFIMPFLINAFEFTLRTIKEYRNDLASRAKATTAAAAYAEELVKWKAAGSVYRNSPNEPREYEPTLTIGHILARLIGIVTPFINFIVMICNMDRVFEWIGECFSWLGRVFSIPLVPKR
jgi:hypothetical protein